VPQSRQLAHLERVAAMAATMRAHYGLEPLQHVSSGRLSLEVQAFAAEYETDPILPLVLFVERSVGDARALRNSDAVSAALSEMAIFARVRFEGMDLHRHLVLCEAAAVMVSVRQRACLSVAIVRLNDAVCTQVHGCDATNIMFMRPGSVAVTVTYIPTLTYIISHTCRGSRSVSCSYNHAAADNTILLGQRC
jgi:hypothetical protein